MNVWLDADAAIQLEADSEYVVDNLSDLSFSEVPTPIVLSSAASVASEGPTPAIAPSNSQALFPAILSCGILPFGTGDGGKSLALSLKPVALAAQPTASRRLNSASLTAAAAFCPYEGALLASGFSKAATKIAAPWMRLLSADAEAPPTSGPPIVWTTCTDGFERRSLAVDVSDLPPHPAFVAAVENALGSGASDTHAQASAMRRVLASWGPVFATRVTLGCARTTSASWVLSEPCDATGLWAAEKLIRDAMLSCQTQKPVGSTPAEKLAVEGLASRLWFNTVGGSPTWTAQSAFSFDADSISNEEHWEVIRIDEVCATISLLERGQRSLYRKVRELLDSAMKPDYVKAVTPPGPIFHFPGRLSAYKYQHSDLFRLNAYVQHDLPDFNLNADFTVCAWILSGSQGATASALCIECVEFPNSLLVIGEWGRDGRLQAIVHHRESLWMRGKGGSLPREQWLHVAIVQSRDQLMFYINGRLEDSNTWKEGNAQPTTRVRICLGRSVSDHKPGYQWDGAIENAKLWSRPLGEDEVSREAHVKNRPAPGHCGAPRY